MFFWTHSLQWSILFIFINCYFLQLLLKYVFLSSSVHSNCFAWLQLLLLLWFLFCIKVDLNCSTPHKWSLLYVFLYLILLLLLLLHFLIQQDVLVTVTEFTSKVVKHCKEVSRLSAFILSIIRYQFFHFLYWLFYFLFDTVSFRLRVL
jgi:hypothetical protein